MKWMKERQLVVDAAQSMLKKGLVAGTSGNISIHLGTKKASPIIGITPANLPYDSMKTEDIVIIDLEAEVLEGELNPSSESLTHIAVYKSRPDVKSVIHTHSLYASALAVAGVDLPPIIDEMVTYLGGAIKVAEYGFPSTEDLGKKACDALGDRNAVLLRNHGVLGVGRNPQEALKACELVERAAHIFSIASLMGKLNLLPPEVVEAEKNIFKMLYHGKPKAE